MILGRDRLRGIRESYRSNYNPHNPRPKFVSSRLLDNSAVDAFVQHF